MLILIAAVAIVGGLCLLDLLLTFGVIRRLREHGRLLAESGGQTPPVIGLAEGNSPAPFVLTATSGERLTEQSGLRIVAFFSSSCSACQAGAPLFADYVGRHHLERDSVLAVVQQDEGPLPTYLDRLTEVAEVYVEPTGGDVGEAFQLGGYPAFCVLDAAGAVVATGYDPAMLPAPQPLSAHAG